MVQGTLGSHDLQLPVAGFERGLHVDLRHIGGRERASWSPAMDLDDPCHTGSVPIRSRHRAIVINPLDLTVSTTHHTCWGVEAADRGTLRVCAGVQAGYQPRARHSGMASRSAPSVESLPCPAAG